MQKGWIKLHRSLLDSDIWQRDNQPFDMRSAWIDLLLLANHDDQNIIFDYQVVTVERGQFITSVRKLGERWKWGKDRVLKYLRLLEQTGMVTRDSDTRRTLITIVNYAKFQDWQDTVEDTGKDTVNDTKQTQSRHGSATNKNIKNEKKNIYNVQFDEFWKNYPRKQEKANGYKCYVARLNSGYSESELLEACLNYADEVKRNGTDQKYIKLCSTFLSVNEPFVDYLSKNYNPQPAKSQPAKPQNKFEKGMINHGYDFSELEKTAFGDGEGK